MIYTIGHEANYLAAIAEHGEIIKSIGGYAFKSLEDAERRIDEEQQHGNWIAWGIDAEWEVDTRPDTDGWWHLLTREAAIIPLKSDV